MTNFELYTFFLCLIVFVLLTTLSVVCLIIITRLNLRLIDSGANDGYILNEYQKRSRKGKKKHSNKFNFVFSFVVCIIFASVFVGSFAIRFTENSQVGDIPVYRVVRTNSMANKNSKNTYLKDNNLNDQIQAFDLIRTDKLPDEMDLKLYDIVVYETYDMLVVHRIVGIEEPNEYHPDCRHFRLQGDAVDSADRYPVLYSQMCAVYSGTRVPFIGSFILFMQSPAGWLCMLLIVVSMIASPILERIMRKRKEGRLILYVDIDEEGRIYRGHYR